VSTKRYVTKPKRLKGREIDPMVNVEKGEERTVFAQSPMLGGQSLLMDWMAVDWGTAFWRVRYKVSRAPTAEKKVMAGGGGGRGVEGGCLRWRKVGWRRGISRGAWWWGREGRLKERVGRE